MSREPQRRDLGMDILRERVRPPELWESPGNLSSVGWREPSRRRGLRAKAPGTREQAGPADLRMRGGGDFGVLSVVKVTVIPAAGHGLRDWRELESPRSTDRSPNGEG